MSELPLPTLPPLPPALKPPAEVAEAPSMPAAPAPAEQDPVGLAPAAHDPVSPAPAMGAPSAGPPESAVVIPPTGTVPTSTEAAPAPVIGAQAAVPSRTPAPTAATAPTPPAPTGEPVDGPTQADDETEQRVLFGRFVIPEWISAENLVEVIKTLPATAVMALVGLLVILVLAAVIVLT